MHTSSRVWLRSTSYNKLNWTGLRRQHAHRPFPSGHPYLIQYDHRCRTIPLQSWLGLGTSASGAGCKRTLPGTHREVRELESAIQWTEYVSLRGQSFSRPTVTFVPCGVEPSAWCQRRVSAPRQRYSCQNCIGGQNGHGRRAVERRISPIPPFTQAVPLPLKVSAHLAAPNTAGGLSRHQARQSPAGDQRRARGGLSSLCSRLDG